ncbi:MAG: 50S ribosome-binding GTPase, partial [Gammaproteobacteria bacterium]
LFNALTDATVVTRDMQVATLDPTVRRMQGDALEVLLADTVGFVSELPHELIAAFRATLLEAREADLLLHVIDVSDPFHSERRAEVAEVLESIGAGSIPCVEVYNKIDLVAEAPAAGTLVPAGGEGGSDRIFVSALTGAGLDALRETVLERVAGGRIRRWIHLEGKDARLRSRLFELGAVSEEQTSEDGGWELHVDLPRSAAQRLARQGGADARVVRDRLLD